MEQRRNLAEDKKVGRDVVNAVMNIPVCTKYGKLLR
jgi:hypothetical protein